MTVSSTGSRWDYVGDNSTTIFAYNNKIFDEDDLDVYLDGTLQTISTHYTVSGVGGDSGGNVTFVTAPPDQSEVIIVRAAPDTQTLDIPPGGSFPAVSIENEFDMRTIISQQQQEELNRSLRYPVNESPPPSGLLASVASRKNRLLGFDSDGDHTYSGSTIEQIDGVVAGNVESSQSMTEYNFVGDGTTTDFTMSNIIVPSRYAVGVYVDGVAQSAEDFASDNTTTAGSTIIKFDTAPPDQAKVRVHILGFSKPVARAYGVNVLEYIPTAEHTAIREGTSTYDATTDIQAAIAQAQNQGGSAVIFPPGTYIITDTLDIDGDNKGKNVLLTGENPPGALAFTSTTYYATAGSSRIKFDASAAAADMIQMSPVSGATNPRLYGGGIQNLVLDGSNKATRCALIKSVLGGNFHNLIILQPTTVGLDLSITASQDGNESAQQNDFRNIGAYCYGGASDAADCIKIHSPDNTDANWALNTFDQLTLLHVNGHGLNILSADTNHFGLVRTRRQSAGGTGRGIYLGGANTTFVPALFNVFEHVLSVVVDGSVRPIFAEDGTYLDSDNRIINMSKSNSRPDPDVEAGANLEWLVPGDGRARFRLSANQTITNNTLTILDWGVTDFELLGNDGTFWSGVNPSRITILAGYGIRRVRLRAAVRWGAGATGTRYIEILKNGLGYPGQAADRSPADSLAMYQSCETGILDVTDNDYFEVRVAHTQGTNLDVIADNQTWFQIEVQ